MSTEAAIEAAGKEGAAEAVEVRVLGGEDAPENEDESERLLAR